MFVPFLDHLLQELDSRFTQLAQDAIKGRTLSIGGKYNFATAVALLAQRISFDTI